MYLIRRQDFFEAIRLGQWTESRILEVGSIWMIVQFCDKDFNNYSFPKVSR